MQANVLPAGALVYRHEKPLFVILLVLSIVLWLALILGTFGVALIYLLVFFIGYVFAQSGFIAWLRGTGTRITPQQFPDLHAQIVACCERLGQRPVPEAYLIHADGAFNAFATRFMGRDFIALYADVVDALAEEPEAINFYIGHELGHVRRGHLVWSWVLFPAGILPIIGAAYRRAQEYTCDLHGLACSASHEVAARGLGALAAGGRRWRTLSLANYAGQSAGTGSFWMSFHELVSSYPWLVKRMARLLPPNEAPAVPRRNPLAYVLALFVPRVGLGGSFASVLVVVAVIGILAAIAIPAYQDYVARAKLHGAADYGLAAGRSVAAYVDAKNAVPRTLAEAGVAEPAATAGIQAATIDSRGVIRIVMGASPLAGKSLLIVPARASGGPITWRCQSEDIPAKQLPPACR